MVGSDQEPLSLLLSLEDGGSSSLQNTLNLYQTTWHYILEDILAIHCHKNLKGKGKVPVNTLKAYGGWRYTSTHS